MAFPNNPSDGQTVTIGGRIYVYDADDNTWVVESQVPADTDNILSGGGVNVESLPDGKVSISVPLFMTDSEGNVPGPSAEQSSNKHILVGSGDWVAVDGLLSGGNGINIDSDGEISISNFNISNVEVFSSGVDRNSNDSVVWHTGDIAIINTEDDEDFGTWLYVGEDNTTGPTVDADWVKTAQADTATDLSITKDADSVTIESSTGNDVTIAAADSTEAGVMTGEDKAKLNGLVGVSTTSITAGNSNVTITESADGVAIYTKDSDTTYTAGTGLNLDGTRFEITNPFTSADKTKLDGIDTGADVTPSWVPAVDPGYVTDVDTDAILSQIDNTNIVAGTNITVVNNGNGVTINSTASGGGGSNYTAGTGIDTTKFADSEIAVDTNYLDNRIETEIEANYTNQVSGVGGIGVLTHHYGSGGLGVALNFRPQNGLKDIGRSDSFSTNSFYFEVDTDVIADTEWVKAQGYITEDNNTTYSVEWDATNRNLTLVGSDGTRDSETINIESINIGHLDSELLITSGETFTDTDGAIATTGAIIDYVAAQIPDTDIGLDVNAAAGSQEATASGTNAIALGASANTSGNQSISIGGYRDYKTLGNSVSTGEPDNVAGIVGNEWSVRSTPGGSIPSGFGVAGGAWSAWLGNYFGSDSNLGISSSGGLYQFAQGSNSAVINLGTQTSGSGDNYWEVLSVEDVVGTVNSRDGQNADTLTITPITPKTLSNANSIALGVDATVTADNQLVIGADSEGHSITAIKSPGFKDTAAKFIQVGTDGTWSLQEAGGSIAASDFIAGSNVTIVDSDNKVKISSTASGGGSAAQRIHFATVAARNADTDTTWATGDYAVIDSDEVYVYVAATQSSAGATTGDDWRLVQELTVDTQVPGSSFSEFYGSSWLAGIANGNLYLFHYAGGGDAERGPGGGGNKRVLFDALRGLPDFSTGYVNDDASEIIDFSMASSLTLNLRLLVNNTPSGSDGHTVTIPAGTTASITEETQAQMRTLVDTDIVGSRTVITIKNVTSYLPSGTNATQWRNAGDGGMELDSSSFASRNNVIWNHNQATSGVQPDITNTSAPITKIVAGPDVTISTSALDSDHAQLVVGVDTDANFINFIKFHGNYDGNDGYTFHNDTDHSEHGIAIGYGSGNSVYGFNHILLGNDHTITFDSDAYRDILIGGGGYIDGGRTDSIGIGFNTRINGTGGIALGSRAVVDTDSQLSIGGPGDGGASEEITRIKSVGFSPASGTQYITVDSEGTWGLADAGGGELTDSEVTASKLDVSGNGGEGQTLSSDGDGSFTWKDFIESAEVSDTGSVNLTFGDGVQKVEFDALSNGNVDQLKLSGSGTGALGQYLVADSEGKFSWQTLSGTNGITVSDGSISLDSLNISDVEVYATTAARNAATDIAWHKGDIAIITGDSETWIYTGTDQNSAAATTDADWTKFLSGASGTTNLGVGTDSATQVVVTSSTGTDATLTAATSSKAGVMTAADKAKLDLLDTEIGANQLADGVSGTHWGAFGTGAIQESVDSILFWDNASGILDGEWKVMNFGNLRTNLLSDNSVGASALNVSGNGTSGQVLSSDGDGSFSWVNQSSGGGGFADSDYFQYQIGSDASNNIPKTLSGDYTVAIGGGGDATASNTVAIGVLGNAGTANNVAIGDSVNMTNASDSVAVGSRSTTNGGTSATALGAQASARHSHSIAIGFDATTDTDNQLVIGDNTAGNEITRIKTPGFTGGANQYIAVDANGDWSTAAVSSGGGGFADSDFFRWSGGNNTPKTIDTTNGQYTVAIGALGAATGDNAVAIGSATSTRASGSVAVGSSSNADSEYAIAIGTSVTANYNHSIAIGRQAATTADNQLVIGSASNLANSITSVRTPGFKPTSGSAAIFVDTDGNWSTKTITDLTLTDTTNTGTVTLDMEADTNFVLTMTGNVTLANPTGASVGQSGFITLKQDATGSRTLTLGSNFKTAGGSDLTISTAANAIDLIPYVVISSSEILLGAPQLAFS